MDIITVAAAIIVNDQGQALLARKQGTRYFMQVGGKLEKDEQPRDGLLREIQEEIGVTAEIVKDLGLVKTMAANEAGTELYAYVFQVKLHDVPHASAELAEICWVDPQQTQDIPLAPLTQDFIFPWLRQNADGFNEGRIR